MRTRTLWLLSLLATVLVLGIAMVVHSPPRDPPPADARSVVPSSVTRAVAVLRAWDRRRALAWAADDRSAVRALYVRGSSAGRGDLAMLAAYHRRGLRVTTMRRQVLAVRVLSTSERRWSLEVTDRLAVARAREGRASIDLPSSRPATRRIVLKKVGAGWRVAEVYDAASPAARTARASSSRNS